MPTSPRRLATIPSRQGDDMPLDTLIDAFTQHHRALGHSEQTIRHYHDSLRLLRRCLAEADIAPESENLTTATMNGFATWLRQTPTKGWRGQTERSIWGVHGALVDIKVFVRWLVEEEVLARAPKVPIPTLPQRLFPILTDEELQRVFASRHLDPRSEMGVRNRALVAFMLDTGVRLAEAAGLQRADLALTAGEARIRGKGNKERLVYISASAQQALQRWLTIRGDGDGPLFWLRVEGVRMVFKRIQIDAELPVFTPHQLRHTALTAMVKQNMDLHSVKRIAGHASVTTTEAYLALAGEDVRAKHQLASPFDRIAAQVQPPRAGQRRLKPA